MSIEKFCEYGHNICVVCAYEDLLRPDPPEPFTVFKPDVNGNIIFFEDNYVIPHVGEQLGSWLADFSCRHPEPCVKILGAGQERIPFLRDLNFCAKHLTEMVDRLRELERTEQCDSKSTVE